jgi:hypothetical protein
VNGDSFDAELFTGPDYPQRDLSTIGNENFLKQAVAPKWKKGN